MSVISGIILVVTVILALIFGAVTILLWSNLKLIVKKETRKEDLQVIGVKIISAIITIAIIFSGIILSSNINLNTKSLEEKTMSSLGYTIYDREKDANIIIKGETFHMYYKFKK